ncbi:ECF transporter S component [Streptococcus thoraltensis]|uniref:ECF transporter S component n=1 Tax=Streptococcus thoraltensis TaxID=55085 RepID=UPI000372AC7F|nr:ECF transporter S component [Streptococcus thoraltensis]MDY4761989.1 ECF transporter S component [Streptococcus thoraltensis]
MSARRVTISALFMAVTIILSASFLSIPVPGGHFYFNGIVIFLVGLLFPPLEAMIVAGIGSFLGDFFFYPAPMFVTLVTHSLQVLVISVVVGSKLKKAGKGRFWLVMSLGALVDIIGYGLGRAFVYANVQYAMLKLPFDLLAVILSMAVVYFLYFKTSIFKDFQAYWNR